jgi:antagonist of KipI
MKVASILSAGQQTSLQDLGREGCRSFGVPVSGPMDVFAHQMANALVGNDDHCAVLEITFGGFECHFSEDALLAVCGFALVYVDEQEIPCWRPFIIRRGQQLHIQKSLEGVYAYLSIGGGWKGEKWLNSTSTLTSAKKGGYQGRNLQKNDVLETSGQVSVTGENILKSIRQSVASWGIASSALPYRQQPVFHCLRGPEWESFTESAQQLFVQKGYILSPSSNRMASKLLGPPLDLLEPGNQLLSKAVCRGNIQVTPDGSIFLLMADAQTTGGYPRIATMMAADMPQSAQMKPGRTFHFRWTSLEHAHKCLLEMEENISGIFQQIEQRFSQ